MRSMQNIQPLTTENGDILLEVSCGSNKGLMHVNRLCQGSKGQCIRYNTTWYTPNEFQYICGRENAKDWKRSINHNGKSLKYLMNKGILTPHPVTCNCQNRKGENPETDEDMNNIPVPDAEYRPMTDETAVSTRSHTPTEPADIDTSSTASPPGGNTMDSDDADKLETTIKRERPASINREAEDAKTETLLTGSHPHSSLVSSLPIVGFQKESDDASVPRVSSEPVAKIHRQSKASTSTKQKKTRGIDLSSFNNSRYNEFLRYIKTLQIGLEHAKRSQVVPAPPPGGIGEQSSGGSASTWPTAGASSSASWSENKIDGQRMIELTKPPNLHIPPRPTVPSSSTTKSNLKRRLSVSDEHERIVDLSVKRSHNDQLHRQADSTVYRRLTNYSRSRKPEFEQSADLTQVCIGCLPLPWCTHSDVTSNDPLSWTTEEVFGFVSKIPGCEEYGEVFQDQMIDGLSLALLNLDHLLDKLGMKLGPALTLKASISRLLNPFGHVCNTSGGSGGSDSRWMADSS